MGSFLKILLTDTVQYPPDGFCTLANTLSCSATRSALHNSGIALQLMSSLKVTECWSLNFSTGLSSKSAFWQLNWRSKKTSNKRFDKFFITAFFFG